MYAIVTGPACTACAAPARNGAPSTSPGRNSILNPYRRLDGTSCCRRMYAVATPPAPPDRAEGNHARPDSRIRRTHPHLRSKLCSSSLGGNPRLDAAHWRRSLHRIGGYVERFGARRRYPRRTQIADEVQLGRLPAELPRLG